MTPDSLVTQIMTRENLSRPFSSGDILRDRYRLDAQIGRGGMGVVYRATDLELRRDVGGGLLGNFWAAISNSLPSVSRRALPAKQSG